jgi:hypothetical protein
MDCSHKIESNIDIVNLMVSDSTHRICVVHPSINTKRCRIGQYEWIDEHMRIVDIKSQLANSVCI